MQAREGFEKSSLITHTHAHHTHTAWLHRTGTVHHDTLGDAFCTRESARSAPVHRVSRYAAHPPQCNAAPIPSLSDNCVPVCHILLSAYLRSLACSRTPHTFYLPCATIRLFFSLTSLLPRAAVNCSEVVYVSWVVMAAPKECIELHNVSLAQLFFLSLLSLSLSRGCQLPNARLARQVRHVQACTAIHHTCNR